MVRQRNQSASLLLFNMYKRIRVHAHVNVFILSRQCTGGSVEQGCLTGQRQRGYFHLSGRPAQRWAHCIHIQAGDYCHSLLSRGRCWLLVCLDPRGHRCHQHGDASGQSGPSRCFRGASWASADPRSVTATPTVVSSQTWSPVKSLIQNPFSRAPDVRRRTIFEYHKVDILKSRISNYTSVEMVPLPSEFVPVKVQTRHTFVILAVALQKMSLQSKQRGSRWPA